MPRSLVLLTGRRAERGRKTQITARDEKGKRKIAAAATTLSCHPKNQHMETKASRGLLVRVSHATRFFIFTRALSVLQTIYNVEQCVSRAQLFPLVRTCVQIRSHEQRKEREFESQGINRVIKTFELFCLVSSKGGRLLKS
jgi:hypothetical protein